jgi:hypothetical protein
MTKLYFSDPASLNVWDILVEEKLFPQILVDENDYGTHCAKGGASLSVYCTF